MARVSARQSASMRSGPRRVIDSVRSAFGTVRRLSRRTAQATGTPSSGPSSTSVSIPRIRASDEGDDDVAQPWNRLVVRETEHGTASFLLEF